ncbi:ABC transporter permease [Allohahella marinimesophila]|uniref:Oligopeptide ABC transporter permease OppB n=1 Tax=Allohahella marinimesophila TaxID=1054972 RepID=A0ABP7P073_9GAMM
MMRYLLNRILYAIVTIWFVATATFFAMHFVPGDPLSNEKVIPEKIYATLQAYYGLDKPLGEQYLIYMQRLLQGDFGVSFTQQNRSVNDIIAEHFSVSAILGLLALIFALFGALIFGSVASIWRRRWPDTATVLGVMVAVSVPSFVFAALAQLFIVEMNQFTGWQVLPVAGWGSISHIWAPALMLGLGTMAFLTRLLRGSLIDTADQPYVLAAQARGLPPWRCFLRYQLRNALLPTLSVMGPTIAGITTGGFVVEQVFAIPGLGRYFVQAVAQLDYTVIMGTTVFYGAFLVIVVLAFDLLYAWADPRIRISRDMT